MGNKFTIHIKVFKTTSVIPPEIINDFAEKLGLQYVPQSEADGNSCLAAHPDVRPEYRDTFTTSHLQDYISAMLQLHNIPSNSDRVEIPYPNDAKEFWYRVQKGNIL